MSELVEKRGREMRFGVFLQCLHEIYDKIVLMRVIFVAQCLLYYKFIGTYVITKTTSIHHKRMIIFNEKLTLRTFFIFFCRRSTTLVTDFPSTTLTIFRLRLLLRYAAPFSIILAR